jgi:hypothetical protein
MLSCLLIDPVDREKPPAAREDSRRLKILPRQFVAA